MEWVPELRPDEFTYHSLVNWAMQNGFFPLVDPAHDRVEYHRLVIERLLYEVHSLCQQPRVEVGTEFRHSYLEPYTTLNNHAYRTEYADVTPDILGTVTNLPFATNSVGSIICMETLEHVPNFFRAVDEIHRSLIPGGVFVASTPFMWPFHGTDQFDDFWRFTKQGWAYLLRRFTSSRIMAIPVSEISTTEVRHLGLAEAYGPDPLSRFHTGYFIVATK